MISTQFLDDNQRVILLKVATDMFGNILKKLYLPPHFV